jgi:hypothetical protein
MPPLNLTRGEADHLLDALRKAWKR